MRTRWTVLAAILAWACLLPGTATRAEDYPVRPITFIVPWGSGGGADQIGRVAARLLEKEFHVSLPVINIPGATGQTGLVKLLTSPADGYTIELMTADTFALQIVQAPRFKLEQLELLGVLIQQQSGLFVTQDSPFKTWEDIKRTAQERALKVAITGFGSPDDLSIGFLRSQGLKLTPVPYPEPGLRYSSVMGGQVDLLYTRPGDIRGLVDGKQVRPLMFFSDRLVAEYPDTPSARQLGYNAALPQFRILVMRSGTPPDRVRQLSAMLERVAADSEFKDQLGRQMADAEGFIPASGAEAYVQDWLRKASQLAASKAK
jgi:tripartite-type tricarboxylate transporter receptor subunit TctC